MANDERTPAATEAEVNAAKVRAFNALADFLETITKLALEAAIDLARNRGGKS